MTDEPSTEWVLIAEAARRKGFRNALACKRWCRANRVALHKVGRKLWVRPSDIDACVSLAAPVVNDTVAHAVESIMQRVAR